MSARLRAWLQTAAAAFLVALLVLVVRLTWESRRSVTMAESQVARHALPEACASFLDAARAYYPGNPYANLAFARLLQLADIKSEPAEAGRDDLERRALEAFRAAALATRSVYIPHASELAVVNERLAKIYARWEQALQSSYRGPLQTATLEQRRQWHFARLVTVPGPSWVWSLVTFFGLTLFLGGIGLFIAKGLSPTLKVQRGPAMGAGLALVVGFVFFLLGLVR